MLPARPEHDEVVDRPQLVVLPGGRAEERSIRKGQVVLALLVLPVALALTVVAITLPPDRGPAPRLPAGSVTPGVVAASRATGPGSLRIESIGASADELARLEEIGLLVLANGGVDSGRRSAVTVVYYDQARREAAQEVQRLLGRGTLSYEPVAARQSDITIIYGKDTTRT